MRRLVSGILGIFVLAGPAAAQMAPPSVVFNIPPMVIATTGTAVCLPALALKTGVGITAQHTSGSGNSTVIAANTNAIFLGGANVTAANGFPIAPGTSVSLSLSNAVGLCINGTAGDGITATGN